MAQNLRDRLRRIRLQGSGDMSPQRVDAGSSDTIKTADDATPTVLTMLNGLEEACPWARIDSFVEKRTIHLFLEREPLDAIDCTITCLVPDAVPLFYGAALVDPCIFRFFDLETTGLSGGAGTVAFLASIGRFVYKGKGDTPEMFLSGQRRAPGECGALLQVTQFLLLDFPGEGVFWQSILEDLDAANFGTVLVSYNGKTFDQQIMRNRCLINGIRLPLMPHLDLLSTARALWRQRLPSCRLMEIETSILGLVREGDLPGSEAPDIWFEFLKTKNRKRLEGVARHNALDIQGLASLLAHLVELAAAPVGCTHVRPVDFESLALRWHSRFVSIMKEQRAGLDYHMLERLDTLLVDSAIAKRLPRVLFLRARELRSQRKWEESRALLKILVHGIESPVPQMVVALASRLLAIDYEWRLKEPKISLEYVESALSQKELPQSLRIDLFKRKIRLEAKHAKSGPVSKQ